MYWIVGVSMTGSISLGVALVTGRNRVARAAARMTALVTASLARYGGPDSLAAGPRGLLRPTEPPRGVTAVTSADLVIVPALAVDRRGRRLGRGGGSYDRALARVGAAVPTVALIYDGELLDEVPAGHRHPRVRMAAPPHEGIVRPPWPCV